MCAKMSIAKVSRFTCAYFLVYMNEKRLVTLFSVYAVCSAVALLLFLHNTYWIQYIWSDPIKMNLHTFEGYNWLIYIHMCFCEYGFLVDENIKLFSWVVANCWTFWLFQMYLAILDYVPPRTIDWPMLSPPTLAATAMMTMAAVAASTFTRVMDSIQCNDHPDNLLRSSNQQMKWKHIFEIKIWFDGYIQIFRICTQYWFCLANSILFNVSSISPNISILRISLLSARIYSFRFIFILRLLSFVWFLLAVRNAYHFVWMSWPWPHANSNIYMNKRGNAVHEYVRVYVDRRRPVQWRVTGSVWW